MHDVMRGTRVLEVASWTFVPAAGAVLADWGADVLKIEHPESGDPQRGLMTMGIMPGRSAGVDFMMEFPNRGKRSVAIDIANDDGRELLYRLAEVSDVFLTNFLPHTRKNLRIDVDDIRARNPRIIYVRGHGQGHRGPESGRGGYDGASYWSRGGVGDTLTPPGSEWPLGLRPAFGDVMGGLNIAGGISAALYAREKTGEAPVVDVSLLGTAMWQIQPDIVISKVLGMDDVIRFGDRSKGSGNPLVGTYRTKDDRHIFLNMMQSDRFFPDLVRRMGHPELLDDERFNGAAARAQNSIAFMKVFDDIFGSKTLAEWKELLADSDGVWAPIQRAPELYDDQQVRANGYLRPVTDSRGNEFELVAAPVQFDERPPDLRSAPQHGEHTDEVLRELLGLADEAIIDHKISGAIL
jgi:crotonobetainyl-CoA:carnitine CoA-transferase CaiB-like acyl-CoA transferase